MTRPAKRSRMKCSAVWSPGSDLFRNKVVWVEGEGKKKPARKKVVSVGKFGWAICGGSQSSGKEQKGEK